MSFQNFAFRFEIKRQILIKITIFMIGKGKKAEQVQFRS